MMPGPKTLQLVHLTMGEIVIPPEVLTPALMDELRRIYAAEGLDFERYVVGGPVGPDGDSLNPVTGLREYFDSAEDSVADNEAAWGGLDDDLGGGGTGTGNESYPADNDENNTRADELRSIAAEAAYNAARAGRSASETGDDSHGDYGGGGGTEDSSIREAETRADPATLGETRRPGVTPGTTPPGQQDARNDPSQPPGIGPNRTAAQDDRPFAQSAQGPGANLGPQDPDKTGQPTDRSGQPAAPGTTAPQTVTRTGPASGRSHGRAPGGQGADAPSGGGGGRTANRSGDPSADPASPDYKAGSVGAARGMEAEAYDFVSMYSERNSGLIGWTAEDVDRVAAEMEGRYSSDELMSFYEQLAAPGIPMNQREQERLRSALSDNLVDRVREAIRDINYKNTVWHFERRAVQNLPHPTYREVNRPNSGWSKRSSLENRFHDNEKGRPEEKYVHEDGREAIFDGDTKEPIANPSLQGTFNYVNAPSLSEMDKLFGSPLDHAEYIARVVGHVLMDVFPSQVLGNSRAGEEEN